MRLLMAYMPIIGMILLIFASSTLALPRGASPDDAAMYAKGDTFTCRDRSQTLPYNRVNDDYCDCADGSDEPGTGACSALGTTFYCWNKGGDPKVIHSMYVDDNICDCCDGSDEKDGVCKDVCHEEGRKILADLEEELQGALKGLAKRKDLIRYV
jgi:protein kinase C substrate 80K-H